MAWGSHWETYFDRHQRVDSHFQGWHYWRLRRNHQVYWVSSLLSVYEVRSFMFDTFHVYFYEVSSWLWRPRIVTYQMVYGNNVFWLTIRKFFTWACKTNSSPFPCSSIRATLQEVRWGHFERRLMTNRRYFGQNCNSRQGDHERIVWRRTCWRGQAGQWWGHDPVSGEINEKMIRLKWIIGKLLQPTCRVDGRRKVWHVRSILFTILDSLKNNEIFRNLHRVGTPQTRKHSHLSR